MNIAIYGRQFSKNYAPSLQKMISDLEDATENFIIYDKFYDVLLSHVKFKKPVSKFSNHKGLDKNIFCLISIGGDGTLLDTLTLIRDSGIPVLGINTGRLGFLSAVSTDNISNAINCLISKQYRIDSRTLIQIKSPNTLFDDFAFALNEFTVMKRETSSMININATIDSQFLNTYWADGLIIATPTGSTGYSLSCGGPIITPESQNFVVTPIASHNLTVRPIVIPDSSSIKLSVEGRITDYLLVLDSRSVTVKDRIEIEICKAPFNFNLICPGINNFYQTIRNKLTWGLDIRN